MPKTRVVLWTLLAMLAFACNSLLCRLALKHTSIDAATFTAVRLASGAGVLWLIVRARGGSSTPGGNWPSAVALFVYAAGFSFAYVSLAASTGALILFGAVQATMIGHGVWRGERLRRAQTAGLVVALGGLLGLLLPGLTAPPWFGALLMGSAGVAWGVYSLHGRGAGDPLRATEGNFVRAAPMAVILALVAHGPQPADAAGLACAVASGAVASAIGYAIWYTALPALRATRAATVQLSVPVITAAGGVLFLGEPATLRLVLVSIAILGGIALVILAKPGAAAAPLAGPR